MALMVATQRQTLETDAINSTNPCDRKHGWGKVKTLAQQFTADLLTTRGCAAGRTSRRRDPEINPLFSAPAGRCVLECRKFGCAIAW